MGGRRDPGNPGNVNAKTLVAGALHGVVGAMSMTGARTLASELGLLAAGTPPERVAAEGTPQLLRPVPPRLRPAAVDLMHLAYGAAGGAGYAALPARWRERRCVGQLFGTALWLTYLGGIAPLLGLHVERRRDMREWAVLAADHLLYGAVVSRTGVNPRPGPSGGTG
jgi:hypothetical protein